MNNTSGSNSLSEMQSLVRGLWQFAAIIVAAAVLVGFLVPICEQSLVLQTSAALAIGSVLMCMVAIVTVVSRFEKGKNVFPPQARFKNSFTISMVSVSMAYVGTSIGLFSLMPIVPATVFAAFVLASFIVVVLEIEQ